MLTKGQKNKIMPYVFALDQYLKDVPDSKQDLLDRLRFFNEEYTNTDGTNEIEINRKTLTKVISGMDEEAWNYFKTELKECIKWTKEEEALKEKLLKEIKKIYPLQDIEIEGLTLFDNNSFEVFFSIGAAVFNLEFEGTIQNLAKAICKMIKKQNDNILTCPYCANSMAKYKWYDLEKCTCGANLVHEEQQPSDLELIIELAGGIKGKPKHDHDCCLGIWFLKDKSFSLFEDLISDERQYWVKKYLNNYLDKNERSFDRINIDDIQIDKYNGIVDKELLKSIVNKTNMSFCDWVFRGNDIRHFYDSEIKYDDSGKLRLLGSNKYFRLKKHATVGDWMENEYTGMFEATYQSGHGMEYYTYMDLFIKDSFFQVVEKYGITNEFTDDQKFTIKHRNDCLNIAYYVQELLKTQYFTKLSTIQCWIDYSEFMMAEIQREEVENEKSKIKRNHAEKIATECWNRYFPELKKVGKLAIDVSRDACNEFISKLDKVVPLLSDEEFDAMEQFPPANGLSNKISNKFENIFKKHNRVNYPQPKGVWAS